MFGFQDTAESKGGINAPKWTLESCRKTIVELIFIHSFGTHSAPVIAVYAKNTVNNT